jgi:hypothetical protein
MKMNVATMTSLAVLGVSFPAFGHDAPKNAGCPHCAAAAKAKASAHAKAKCQAQVRAGDVKSSFSGKVVVIGPDGKTHEYSFGRDGKKVEGKARPLKRGGEGGGFKLERKVVPGERFQGHGGHGHDLSKLLEMALRHSGAHGAQPKFRFEHRGHQGPHGGEEKLKGHHEFRHDFDLQGLLEKGMNNPELQKLAQQGLQKLAEEGLQNGSLEEMLKFAQGAAGNGALDKLAEEGLQNGSLEELLKFAQGAAGNGALDKLAEEGLQNGSLEELLKFAQGAAEDGTMDKLLGEFLGGLEGGQLVPAPEVPAAPKAKKPAPRHEHRAAPKGDQTELKKLSQELKEQRALLESLMKKLEEN